MQAPRVSARVRKGGYGDAGGLAANGELPDATPLALDSEGELRDEVDRIVHSLAPASEWVERVNGLLRVEGLVLGGAPEQFPHAFPEALSMLRDPLAKQLQERRSAVSRQACHALTLLALACGPRIEGLAGALVPSLFKAMAMGIQVVTDAADACVRIILRHCQPRGLVPKLAETAAHERQGRLRQCAAEYLLLILGEWDAQAYARHLPALEAAVLSMVQDAQNETRATGREAFGALAHTWQDSARSMLHRVDRGMQEKLERAAEDYVPGGHHAQLSRQASVDTTTSSGSGAATPTGAAAGHGAFGNTGKMGGALRVVPVPRLMLHSMGGQGQPEGGAPAGAGASFGGFHSSRLTGVAATPAACAPASARENSRPNAVCPPTYLKPGDDGPARGAYGAEERPRARSRKSMGGAALRIAMAAARDQEEEAGRLESAVRVARPPTAMSSEDGRGGQDGSEAGPLDGGAEGNFSGFWSEPSGPSVSVLALLAGLSRAGVDWRDKMELFQQLGEAASQAGGHQAGEVAANVERVSAALLDGIGDAHFKVATSALVALHAALSGPGVRFFEPQLDRIVPALFARVADGKEQVRQLVTAALDPLPAQHPPEVVLAALGKALHSNKAPRVKCAIMDFFSNWAAGGVLPAGGAAGEEHLSTARGQGQRALVTGIMALASDKNPDIRRSAVAAAAAAYRAGDAGVVLAALHALPAEKMAAAQKALVAAVGARDAVAAAAAPRRPAPATAAPAPAAPAAAVDDTAAASQPLPEAQPVPKQDEATAAHEAEPASQAPSTPTHAAPVAEAGFSVGGGQLAHLGSITLAGSPKMEQMSSPLARTRSPVQFTPSSGGRAPSAAAAAAVAPTPEPPSPFVYWASNGTPLAIKMPALSEAVAPGAPSSPVGDGGALGAQLRSLTSRLEGDAGADVFAGLSHLAAALPATAWPGYFNQVVAAIAETSGSGSAPVREAALLLGRDLAAGVEPALLASPALGLLLPHLLRCAGDGDRSVALAAEEALEAVMGRVDPLACLRPLQQQLPAAGAAMPAEPAVVAALRASIVGLRFALPRLPPAKLLPAVQAGLLPRLFYAYDSPAADVRKATVDCLAAIWAVLGEAMAPLLEPLTPAQLKLVAIYRDRISVAALM